MDIDSEQFRVAEGSMVRLDDRPTRIEPLYASKKEYRKLLEGNVGKLSDAQARLYASDTYSLLIILQAMDAAGKDSVIKHVMTGVNPQGTQVTSFKHPGPNELEHDFLWRTVQYLPERGRIGIFNRSYYEEVLIVRVHRDLLIAERLPEGDAHEPDIWQGRFASIRDHEAHLTRNGTRVVKFFLHISKEEQRKRFLSRIEEPDKNWKFDMDDMKQRESWDDYMRAYEESISATSTEASPWYIVPADGEKNARLIVSDVIAHTLTGLALDFPEPSPEHLQELETMRVLLSQP
jgi:PPK2 family polyphosphate:nucleotide phosphotransferase